LYHRITGGSKHSLTYMHIDIMLCCDEMLYSKLKCKTSIYLLKRNSSFESKCMRKFNIGFKCYLFIQIQVIRYENIILIIMNIINFLEHVVWLFLVLALWLFCDHFYLICYIWNIKCSWDRLSQVVKAVDIKS
jgi:hypothetical protein